MIELRQAKQSDVDSFYKGLTPYTISDGIAAVNDGEVIGIGGTYQSGGFRMVFCDIKPEARKFRKATVKAAKMLIAALKPGTYYATASTSVRDTDQWLLFLGFKPTGMVLEDGPLYRLERY